MFNFLINFGVLITLPTLISLSIVLSVPVNAGELPSYLCDMDVYESINFLSNVKGLLVKYGSAFLSS